MYFLVFAHLQYDVYQMSNRHLLDGFKMFMIYYVCNTDILQTSARCLYTTSAFQIKRTLTDSLSYLSTQAILCVILAKPALLKY